MALRLRRMMLCLVCGLAAAATARAQDFSVFTQVYNEHETAKRPVKAQPIAHSTTLFHAGKVYDFPVGGQVTVFEPAHEQFIVIDYPRRLKTSISFEEIGVRIHRAEKRTEQYIEQMLKDRFPDAGKLAPHLRFQIEPKFQEAYDSEKHVLSLKSRQLNYEVKCDESQSPELIDVYLRYTDWTARLSYLSRPHALLPGPRLALDEVLRRRKLLPTEVVLRSEPYSALHLKAVHSFNWRFDATHRRTITEWENHLNGKGLEPVSFDAFLEKTIDVAQQKTPEKR